MFCVGVLLNVVVAEAESAVYCRLHARYTQTRLSLADVESLVTRDARIYSVVYKYKYIHCTYILALGSLMDACHAKGYFFFNVALQKTKTPTCAYV